MDPRDPSPKGRAISAAKTTLMTHRPLLLLGVVLAGCGGGPSGASMPVDGGDCLTNPLGRSSPPSVCVHVLPSSDDCASAAPSYDLDIAPTLTRRCVACHSAKGVATRVQFDTYSQAYGWYKLMYSQIYSCQMPPSCAGPLPDDERTTLLKWFVCKAPPGPSEPRDAGADEQGDP